jgi:hypothetical protein
VGLVQISIITIGANQAILIGEIMLSEIYKKLDSPVVKGENIVLPNSSHEAIYLSEYGELFCYTGIFDKDRVMFESWPYFLHGKHTYTKQSNEKMKGLFRIKNGCILLAGFVDHKFYNQKHYKQLKDYILRLPVPNLCYFGIEKRIESDNTWHFEENEELTRACFGLTCKELEYLLKIYAERLGISNPYCQYPRLTRSMRSDNYCDITGLWIPAGFPYIALNESGYAYSHVSLYGFYRHVGTLVTMGSNTNGSQIFEHKTFGGEIIKKIQQINDYFPYEIKLTSEYIHNWSCTVLDPEQ